MQNQLTLLRMFFFSACYFHHRKHVPHFRERHKGVAVSDPFSFFREKKIKTISVVGSIFVVVMGVGGYGGGEGLLPVPLSFILHKTFL